MSTIVPKNYSPTLISERRDLVTAAQKSMQMIKRVSSPTQDQTIAGLEKYFDKAFKDVAIELILLTAAAATVIIVIYVLFKPLISSLFSSILDTVNGITTVTSETLATITETLGSVIESASSVVETVVTTTANSITTISGTITDTLATGVNVIAGPPTKSGTYSQTGTTTVTITITNHGYGNGDPVDVIFKSGSQSADGTYTVANSTDNTFTITVPTILSTSGNVTVKLLGEGIVPVIADSVKQISYLVAGDPTVVFSTPPTDEEKFRRYGVIRTMADGVIAVVDAVTDPTTGLIPNILTAVNDSIDVFKNVMTEAQNAFIGVINAIKTSIENVVSGIQDGIRFLVEPFLNTSYGIPAIARNLYETVNEFSSSISTVGSDIKDGITSVKDAILGLGSVLGV